MDTKRICPGCQKPLPPDVPLGLCPECLIKAGFNTGTEPGSADSKFIPPPVEQIAKLFPQLEIISFIGKGGMGAVYKARQPALDRFVALKVLPPRVASDPGFAERFNREARALARLNHPNIVAVHDFGRAELPLGQDAQQRVPTTPVHYLIMEFVDGANLREVERSGRLAPEQALAIVPQICEALQFAHNEGIVHRDIKPENILLDKRGRVKITDFGIAKMLGVSAGNLSLTGAKDVVGTPHYMAPEQIEKPTTVDHRADIYSLGVVFYEMLTGELPLGKFAPPSRACGKVQVDVRLDEVVLHALEKEPARRYQQVSQVKTDVETIAGTVPPVAGFAARAGAAPPPMPGPARAATSDKTILPAFLLAFFFGVFGAHRFYVGKTGTALLQLFTFGACGIWATIDWILILCKAFTDGQGRRITEWFHPHTGELKSDAEQKAAPAIKGVKEQVRGPAIGLLVTGILNWVLIPLVMLKLGPSLSQLPGAEGIPKLMFAGIALLPLLLCSFIIYAAFKMMQLERRGVAIVASVLAMLVTPGNLIGLPMGIWALVVLSRREVREAFAQNPRSGWSAATAAWALAVATVLGLMVIGPCVLSSTAHAQPKFLVTGKVTDAVTGKPIAGARVDDNRYGASPQNAPQAAWTDTNGSYQLKTWYEEHTIAASAPGYKTKLEVLFTKPFGREREAQMDFHLQPRVAERTDGDLSSETIFGPGNNMLLKYPEQRMAKLLDLDTGKYASSTNFGENDLKTHAWVRENKLDVLGVVEKEQIAVLGMDMAVVPAASNRWEEFVPAEVTTNWGLNQQLPKPITTLSPVTDNTDTWFFRTREGGRGVLQILHKAYNFPGIVVRYRLVQPPTNSLALPKQNGQGLLSEPYEHPAGGGGFMSRGEIRQDFNQSFPLAADGSYAVAEFQPESGAPQPITVRVEKMVGSSPPKTESQVIARYRTAPVMKGDLSQSISATGTLDPISGDSGKWRIAARVNEADIAPVETGQPVVFTVDAFPTRKFTGRVLQISNAPTRMETTVAYETTLAVDDPDPKFRPGMTANTAITVAHREAVLRIPNQAMRFRPPGEKSENQKRGTERTVYVLPGGNESTPQPVQIKTGITDGISLEVTEGLKEGDSVVLAMLDPQTGAELLSYIDIRDVPLPVAIKHLADQLKLNYVFDPQVASGPSGPDGRPLDQQLVTARWENITAQQALTTLLNNYHLQLEDDPKTGIARITAKSPESSAIPVPSTPPVPPALPTPATVAPAALSEPYTHQKPDVGKFHIIGDGFPILGDLVARHEICQNFNQTLPLTPDGRLSLDNVNGRVEVTGWDRNEVAIKAVKHGRTREGVEAVQIEVESRPDRIAIHTRQPENDFWSWWTRFWERKDNVSVDYTIQVPRRANLEKIVSVNGEIVIAGIAGNIAANTVNGVVQTKGARGDLKLATVNGRIEAHLAALGAGQSVSLNTVNGGIEAELPPHADVIASADTVNGSIHSEFPALKVKKDFPLGSHLNGMLWEGKARFKASTVNGSIHIRDWGQGTSTVVESPAYKLVSEAVSPGRYTQNSTMEIQPDGEIRFTTTMTDRNQSSAPQTTIQFKCSDFVNVQAVRDAQGRSIPLTFRHDVETIHYHGELKEPVPGSEWFSYTTEGTMRGLVKPTAETGVFEYRMRHWPAIDGTTRRIETHRLPAGAQVLYKEPKDLGERTHDGRTELFIERLILQGDSLEVVYRYRLPVSTGQTSREIAVSAAHAWLSLIDEGHYVETWQAAAAYFQGAMAENTWTNTLTSVRKPLGTLASRQLKAAQEATSLPGAPDGRYVVMEFDTSFAGKKSAVETVTFVLEKDGKWKAAGYLIR